MTLRVVCVLIGIFVLSTNFCVLGAPTQSKYRLSSLLSRVTDADFEDIDVDGPDYSNRTVVPIPAPVPPPATTTFNDASLSTLLIVPILPETKNAFWTATADERIDEYFQKVNVEMCDVMGGKDYELCPKLIYPMMDAVTKEFVAVVPAAVREVTMVVKTACEKALITVGGRLIVSGQPTKLPPLQRCFNYHDIVVTAEDRQTVTTYRLNLQREVGSDDFDQLKKEELEYSLQSIQTIGCFGDKARETPVFDPEDSVWYFAVDYKARDWMRSKHIKMITPTILGDNSNVEIIVRPTDAAINSQAAVTIKIFDQQDNTNRLIKSPCAGTFPCFQRIEDSATKETRVILNFPRKQSTLVAHIVVTAADNHISKTYCVKLERGLDGLDPSHEMKRPDCGKFNQCSGHGNCIFKVSDEISATDAPEKLESMCDCDPGYVFQSCSDFIGSRTWLHLHNAGGELTEKLQTVAHAGPYYTDISEMARKNISKSVEYELPQCFSGLDRPKALRHRKPHHRFQKSNPQRFPSSNKKTKKKTRK